MRRRREGASEEAGKGPHDGPWSPLASVPCGCDPVPSRRKAVPERIFGKTIRGSVTGEGRRY